MTDAEGLANHVEDLELQVDVDRELIAALGEQGVLDRAQTDTLETALTTWRRIRAAMGILMANEKVTESGAFDLLRGASQRNHQKLRDLADDVLLTGILS